MLSFFLLIAVQASPPPTTIYVVRHAEKAAGDNPPLTQAGHARAAALAAALRDIELDAVFTTNLCRTAQTVAPAARAAGLPLRMLRVADADVEACAPRLAAKISWMDASDDAEQALVSALRGLPAGSHALVAGHSNTVPGLLEALGAPSLCPGTHPRDAEGHCWLPHQAYDDLFVVSLPGHGPARLQPLHYGTPTPVR
ncbi:MAG: histidine phosphatase family protein [Myxococcota bacterium]|nr:histidine phosphatase family protein [Myxococcota bacterium]